MKNKRLLKCFLSFALILTLLFGVSGCAILSLFRGKGTEFPTDLYANRDDFKFNYTQEDFDDYLEIIDKTYEIAQDPDTSSLKFSYYTTELGIHRLRLVDAYHLARILYYSDTTNQENYQTFIDIDEKYNLSTNEFNRLYGVMAESKFKEDFFGDMTDEEIQALVEYSIPMQEKVDLSNQITDIQTRFNSLTRQEQISSQFDEYYTELIEAQNSLALLGGYENHSQESYAVTYGRDYTPQDTLTYVGLLKDCLFESVKESVLDYKDLKVGLTTDQINYCNAILQTTFYSEQGKTILDGFYRSLGQDIYDVYTSLMEDGYYYVAYNKNAYQGAFTSYFVTLGQPYMYFSGNGSSYTSISTFVHEFGHYLSFYFEGTSDNSTYELMETHSQAAEWLFNAYLKDVVTGENCHEYIVGTQLYSDGYTMLLSALVGAFEVYAYSTPLSEGQTYTDLMISIKNDVFGQGTLEELYTNYVMPETYFKLVTIPHPSYYISYSVSLISSLQIYALALDDYDNAVSVYTQLLTMQNGYLDSLSQVGLSSPFESQTYALVSRVFSATETE